MKISDRLVICGPNYCFKPTDDNQPLNLKASVAIMKCQFFFFTHRLGIIIQPASFLDEAEWMNSFFRVLIQVKQQLGIDCGENALGT